jgi:preprotein translocase subunit Sec61beta
LSLTVTLALIALTGAGLALSIWQERRPAEPLQPKLVPWIYLSMTLMVVLLVLAAHAVAELTGVELKGRYGG